MRLRASMRLAWFDLWIGVYVDAPNRTLYVCPLPCLLLKVEAL